MTDETPMRGITFRHVDAQLGEVAAVPTPTERKRSKGRRRERDGTMPGVAIANELKCIDGNRRLPYVLIKSAFESLQGRKATRDRLSAIYWLLFDTSTHLTSLHWCCAVLDMDVDAFRQRTARFLAQHRVVVTREQCEAARAAEYLELYPGERIKRCCVDGCAESRAPRCQRCAKHCARHDHTRATQQLPVVCHVDDCDELRVPGYSRCQNHQQALWRSRNAKFRETQRRKQAAA